MSIDTTKVYSNKEGAAEKEPDLIKVGDTVRVLQKIESKSESFIAEYFPTTIKQAQEGVRRFLEAQEKSSVFRRATKEEPDLLHTIAGLKPEIGFYWNAGFDKAETAEEKDELRRIYEETCGMKVFIRIISRRSSRKPYRMGYKAPRRVV